MAKKYYAYFLEDGNISGTTSSWDECKEIVKGQKARYKGFKTEPEAKTWLKNGALYDNKKADSFYENLKPGIYFDSGTGRGIGVEVRVTNEKGENLIHKVVPKEKINEFGNYLTQEGSTNNFGELLGLYIALKIAIHENIKFIFGDSKLVINFWSKGYMNKDKLQPETVKLINMVKLLRKKFETNGGTLEHVSGDINPADLGFHK